MLWSAGGCPLSGPEAGMNFPGGVTVVSLGVGTEDPDTWRKDPWEQDGAGRRRLPARSRILSRLDN